MDNHFDLNNPDQSEKAFRRQKRKQEKTEKQSRRNPKPIEARGESQKEYIKSIHHNELTFAVGPAGVGKTYVPSRIFGQMIAEGQIDKLYLARPNVAKSKHRMGFLPGTAEEKTAPWLVPVLEGLKDSMAPALLERLRREGKIEIVPYEFMQGRTFANAAWIVDEAENLDLDDLYITLTRQGENLKAVISGDIRQSRINNSGLAQVVAMGEQAQMESVGVVRFGEDEVVRSRQARQWVRAFNRVNLSDVPNCGMDEVQSFQSGLPNFLRKDD
jgi:phosphate starvation-inducible PhoH-like protein